MDELGLSALSSVYIQIIYERSTLYAVHRTLYNNIQTRPIAEHLTLSIVYVRRFDTT